MIYLKIKEDADAYDDGPSNSGLAGKGTSGSGGREEGQSGKGPREEGPSASGPGEESPWNQEEEEEEEEGVNDEIVDPGPEVSTTEVGSKKQEAAPVGTGQVAKHDREGDAKHSVKTSTPPTVIPGTLGMRIPPDSLEKKTENKEPLMRRKDTPKSETVSPNLCPSQTLNPEAPMKTAGNPADGPEAASSWTHGIHPPAEQSKLA